ncbi:MAG TPA: zf-HC2 domain-containing protein [Pyrinomonadaceae bacterium]|jgi:anti-sigma factor RsiW
MLCEEIKQSLSLYVDDCVSLPTRVAIDEHLGRCPVCRDELIELRLLKRRLSLLTSPAPPPDLAATISDALAIEAAARRQQPTPSLVQRVVRFIEPRLMPYSIGSFASVLMFFLMFTALRPHFVALREAALQSSGVIMVEAGGYDLYQPVTPEDFAASRAPFGIESPSLRPGGALATLTISYATPRANTHGDADDMVVIANVFSNGAASLADVVQPPRDKRMLDEFESALRQDAAFVPASADRRPDTMRVVFTMQKVDVDDRNF